MTPLSLIETGILAGDWKDVCAGFNKLTGKKLEPPKPVPQKVEPVFDPKTAKKTQLYKELLRINKNLAPAKAYTLEDLREMWDVYLADQQEVQEVQEEIKERSVDKSIQVLDGFRFVKDPNKLLYDDKKSVRVTEDRMLDKIQENPNFERKQAVSRPTKVKAKCTKCKSMFNTYRSYAAQIDGELIGMCDVCKESK